MTGLRISAGLAVLGVAFSGIAPGFSSPGEPITLIGGSALIIQSRPASTSGGGPVWTLAALAQDAMPPPPAVGEPIAAKPATSPPTFSIIEIAPDGRIHFEGRGTPGTRVTLNRFDRPFASAIVTQEGAWSVTVDARIGAGEHQFSSLATRTENGLPVAGSDVRIAIPKEFGRTGPGANGSAEKAADHAAGGGDGAARQRRRAEQLARDASQEFTDIEHRRISELQPGRDTSAAPTRSDAEASDPPAEGGLFFWLQEWLASSNRDFQGKIVRRLQIPAPGAEGDVVAEPRSAPEIDKSTSARQEATVKAQADAEARAEVERAARAEEERIAAERKREAERRAAAAADARDAEVARQAEAERQVEAAHQAEAARKAEQERRTAEAEQQSVRQEAAAQEARRQHDARQRAAAESAERELRLREQRERALLAAEIEEKHRRAEERRRRDAEQQRLAAKPSPTPPPTPATDEPARSAPSSRHDARRGLRGGDGTPAEAPEPAAAAKKETVAPPATDRAPDQHVMPERWRRFAELHAESRPRTNRASSPTEAGRPGPRRTETVMGNPNRLTQETCPGAGRRIRPPGIYVVGTGDSLWRISQRHYHKGALWPVIYRANDAKIDDPDLIFPCQRFEIPASSGR